MKYKVNKLKYKDLLTYEDDNRTHISIMKNGDLELIAFPNRIVLTKEQFEILKKVWKAE